MKRVLVLAGTRPEVIKVAPVVRALRDRPADFSTRLCISGQHRELLDQALEDFELVADASLKVMTPGQTLASLSARLYEAIDRALEDERPDVILVQGDTTTVHVAALCAFYRGIAVGHIEAGLRTNTIQEPFPEELNRRVVTLVTSIFFAPTTLSRDNLLAEGVAAERIHVTGNTVIDALIETVARVRARPPVLSPRIEQAIAGGRRIVLVTCHRRENFGARLHAITGALAELCAENPDVDFVLPVHPNPNVREVVSETLSGIPNMILDEPLPYQALVRLLDASYLVLTDSGGLQEEAPSLGKPVLVLRDATERPEGVTAGTAKLVGADPVAIKREVTALLTDRDAYLAMSQRVNPYGDGTAAMQIADALAAMVL